MNQARVRLIVAAVAFVAWIGWLFYLARPYLAEPPITLSRPQFLKSQVAVVAHVESADKPVTILEVREGDDTVLKAGDEIAVENLDQSLTKPAPAPSAKGESKDPGEWETPGDFIIPLVRRGSHWHVASLPETRTIPQDTPRIYPKTPETLEQFHNLPKAASAE
jgi:hypothetical protein